MGFTLISPNGQWLIFYEGHTQGDTYTAALWISSIDGNQQWVVTDIDYQTDAYWISDELILITSPIPESGIIESNLNSIFLLINPFTGESQNSFALPTGSRPLILNFDNAVQRDYELILDGSLKLFDYWNGISTPIFPWIPGYNIDNPTFLYFDLIVKMDVGKMFDIAVKRPYGLDAVSDLDYEVAINTTTGYDFVMTKFTLPNEHLDTTFLKWVPYQNVIIVDRHEYPSTNNPETHRLYSLDVDNYVMYDYCFDFNNVTTVTISSDGRYLAWSFTDERFNSLGSMVLELETGHIAQLNNWQVIGWGTK